MTATAEHLTLLDVDAYTMQQVDEEAVTLMKRYQSGGWGQLTQCERKQLRLLRTLLDGFAEPPTS